jgi:hypothetical protein
MERKGSRTTSAAGGATGMRGRLRPFVSLSAFHFVNDGFTDSIYILLPFIAAELHLSLGEVGLLRGVAGAVAPVVCGLASDSLGVGTTVAVVGLAVAAVLPLIRYLD